MGKITTPAELRAVLLASIERVCNGRMNVAQANALVGLSAEVHKSIRQENELSVFASKNLLLPLSDQEA